MSFDLVTCNRIAWLHREQQHRHTKWKRLWFHPSYCLQFLCVPFVGILFDFLSSKGFRRLYSYFTYAKVNTQTIDLLFSFQIIFVHNIYLSYQQIGNNFIVFLSCLFSTKNSKFIMLKCTLVQWERSEEDIMVWQ